MPSFHESVLEYRRQLAKGAIKQAYCGLMEYMMALRTHFADKYPDHFVSGSIYFGYMDMTYFSFSPQSLRDRKLKIAVVFLHDTCRFEVWLAAANKQVQAKYWKLIKDRAWTKYHLVAATQGADSIVEHVLVEEPGFDDLPALTRQIEKETVKFIKDVEGFLAKQPS